MAKIEALRELNLKTLDPLIAFNSLKGIAARSLELTPITPQVKINVEDKRFVEAKDILGNIESSKCKGLQSNLRFLQCSSVR